ncbi:MAG TPA: FMN-binding protein [Bryobacteraceae bacterium]|nr:FMN-binding protein [Bryobacteraceae bacterium]
MPQSGPKNKVANSLVAMSSAVVLAVYTAGYTRTRSAAHRLEAQAAERAPAMPARTVTHDVQKDPVVASETPAQAPSVRAAETEGHRDPVAAVKAVPAAPAPVPSEAPAEAPAPAPAAALAAPAESASEPKTEAVSALPAEASPPAPAAATTPAAPAPAPTPTWKDGTYTGWGSSRHGDIQAAVVIQGGRIESASIAQCRTRYSCSVIDRLPPEVSERQSAEVDYVSGATQSANAFYWAVMDALSKAK